VRRIDLRPSDPGTDILGRDTSLPEVEMQAVEQICQPAIERLLLEAATSRDVGNPHLIDEAELDDLLLLIREAAERLSQHGERPVGVVLKCNGVRRTGLGCQLVDHLVADEPSPHADRESRRQRLQFQVALGHGRFGAQQRDRFGEGPVVAAHQHLQPNGQRPEPACLCRGPPASPSRCRRILEEPLNHHHQERADAALAAELPQNRVVAFNQPQSHHGRELLRLVDGQPVPSHDDPNRVLNQIQVKGEGISRRIGTHNASSAMRRARISWSRSMTLSVKAS
jgi:hypothetical protein